MDELRLRKLAGIDTTLMEDYNKSVKELDLLEKTYPLTPRPGFNPIDTEKDSLAEVQKRMEAATRAVGLINRLKDPEYRRQHLSRIRKNINSIQAALAHMEKQGQSEQPAPEEDLVAQVGM